MYPSKVQQEVIKYKIVINKKFHVDVYGNTGVSQWGGSNSSLEDAMSFARFIAPVYGVKESEFIIL